MKDQDLRRIWGLTWAGWLNVLLQFTGFRLRRVVEEEVGTFLTNTPAGEVATVQFGPRDDDEGDA